VTTTSWLQRQPSAPGKLDALASVTANLYYENQQMRCHLGGRHASAMSALPAKH
jgi:hypothetical protein